MTRLFIVSACFLILASSLCEVGDEVPALPADCSAQVFNLRGEVTTMLVAEVQPHTEYRIELRGVSTSHPMDAVAVSVSDSKGDFIATDNEVFSGFDSSDYDKIYVWISSTLGERNDDLGTFEVKLCENGV